LKKLANQPKAAAVLEKKMPSVEQLKQPVWVVEALLQR
jgi:hypothetical protein